MAAILYTDTKAIRSVLGVTEFDVRDEQLEDRGLDIELRADLSEWLPAHAQIHADGVASGASAEEAYLADLLHMHCTYRCAEWVAQSGMLSIPQQVSDGKNTMKRYPGSLSDIEDRMAYRAALYRGRLLAELGAVEALPSSPVSGVTNVVDPVTDTGR